MSGPASADDLRVRRAGRVVLLTDDGRILLFLGNSDRGEVWTTPGGMVEDGETDAEAAARELWEETGRADSSLGPCVWHRRRIRPAGPYRPAIDSRSSFFLARTPHFELDLASVPAEEDIRAYRWWSLDEIREEPPVRFIPQRLAELLAPLLRGELPAEPVDACD